MKFTVTALNVTSKVCYIATQHEKLTEPDKLIQVWQDFLRAKMPEQVFTINQNYLSHLTDIIRDISPYPKSVVKV